MSAPPRDDVLAHRAFTTRLPPPGSGRTRARFRRLWSWAAVSPTLGRLAEAHHDALAILAEAGRPVDPVDPLDPAATTRDAERAIDRDAATSPGGCAADRDGRRRALRVRHLVDAALAEVAERLARAGGPRMLALGTDVQLRLAEVELYRRQCHAESDLEVLGSIAAERDVGAPDQPGAPTLDQRSGS